MNDSVTKALFVKINGGWLYQGMWTSAASNFPKTYDEEILIEKTIKENSSRKITEFKWTNLH